MKKVIAKAMSYKQFRDFLKYAKTLKEMEAEDQGFAMAEWVAKEIYDIDPETTTYTAGTLMDLMVKTKELSERSEVEDLKNSGASGTGE